MSQENAPAGVSAEAHAAAVEQARQEGRRAGAQDERKRIGAILQCEETRGREAMAQTFALETDMDAATAQKLLAKAPVVAKASANPLDAAMAGIANPKIGAGDGEAGQESAEAAAQTAAMAIINAGKTRAAK